jgi:hypothetical protein
MIVELLKFAGGFAISAGVGSVVENAIAFTTPAVVSTLQKVLIRVGGIVITSMIAEKGQSYVEDRIKKVLTKQKKDDVVEVKPE